MAITQCIADGNEYMASARKRKAERLFGILHQAGIETEADFALVTDDMWRMAAGVAGKEYPSMTVKSMVALLFERNAA